MLPVESMSAGAQSSKEAAGGRTAYLTEPTFLAVELEEILRD